MDGDSGSGGRSVRKRRRTGKRRKKGRERKGKWRLKRERSQRGQRGL